jgi:hypothetical protein
MEDEVQFAQDCFRRIERNSPRSGLFGLFGQRTPLKKSIFFRRIEHAASIPGLSYVQLVHGYCNFKFYSSHNNAKFLGLLAGFADGRIVSELVDDRGVVDIWLSDERLQDEFSCFPALARYAKRFRVLS